ncbi:MAG TPA: FAD-binding oxidoreductase [Methylomirabilota bacterium]|jgi:glycolate oxidase FAD binding subunit|nr:FAD-binding oxidoreductase [Methylomirabilota bacterium]
MSVSTRSLEGTLAEIVGRERVSAEPRLLAAAAIDGHAPRWVVSPAALEQVAAVLALAHDEKLAVVARGSGSALDLGRPPVRLDAVLDMRGLTRIIEDHPDDLTVSVEAGITAGALAARLAARRQWLPVDPPAWQSRTIGGLVATNAHGPLRARYGTLRDLLLGVRFVAAGGVSTWGGSRVVKSVTGYDVPKLMVGSLGTLGVLTELTLRLHPMPESELTWLAAFPSTGAAQAFVARVLDSPLQPSRVELLNEAALRACAATPARAAVAVAIGSVEAAVRDQGALVEDFARRAGGGAAGAPAAFWERYDRAFTRSDGQMVLQVASLTSRLADTVDLIERGHDGLGSDAALMITGCAALGTLRVTLTLTGADLEAAAGFVERLRAFVGDFEGSVVIQSGPAVLRAGVDPWGAIDPAALTLMRALKDEFDPQRLLNPGRFVGGL